MNDKYIYFGIVAFFIIAAIIIWFRKLRKKHREFIKPPKSMPKRDTVKADWFSEKTPTRTIWKVQTGEIQHGGSVECTAYTLRSYLMASPLNMPTAPSVKNLFLEIRQRDDQSSSEFGLNPIGALKYLEQKGFTGKVSFLTKIARTFGFRHSFFNFDSTPKLIEYVKNYAPVMAGLAVHGNPRISDAGILYAMDGGFAFGHSVLLYGVDTTMACPNGTIGAFKVRWHLNWFDSTDGWIAISLMEQQPRNQVYGVIFE
jgi:hypothetical protein